jgi:acyl-CoA synthetase (AMP-forming)/AMP-acid ligase II
LYFDSEDDSLAMTGPQVVTSVKKLIAGLKVAGVKKGDCVCLHMFNNVSISYFSKISLFLTRLQHVYTCLYFAIIGSGAAYTGTNPAYTVFELSHRFELCTPQVVITVPDHLATVQAACKGVPDSKIKIFVLDEEAKTALAHVGLGEASVTKGLNGHCTAPENENAPSVASLLAHGSSDWMRITDEKTARETTACLFPTSGTTGMPKLCRLSHHAEIAKNLSFQSEGKDYQVRTLVSVPLFHIFGAALVHVNAIRRGEPVYVMSRFDLKKYATAIQKYSITDTATTPLMVVYLLKSGLPLRELLSSLRYIWCGSAPIDAAVLNRFYEVLSPKAIITGLWGMSETGAQTFFKWPERDMTGSVGRLSPGTEIRCVPFPF